MYLNITTAFLEKVLANPQGLGIMYAERCKIMNELLDRYEDEIAKFHDTHNEHNGRVEITDSIAHAWDRIGEIEKQLAA